jgi:hypothetical protein
MAGGPVNLRFQHALVASGSAILAEVSLVQCNARASAERILESVDPASEQMLVEQPEGTFRTLTDQDRLTFLVLVEKTVLASSAVQFLRDVRKKWIQRYGERSSGFAPGSENQEFGEGDLRTLMNGYNSDAFAKIERMQANLDAMQEGMKESQGAAMSGGE